MCFYLIKTNHRKSILIERFLFFKAGANLKCVESTNRCSFINYCFKMNLNSIEIQYVQPYLANNNVNQ